MHEKLLFFGCARNIVIGVGMLISTCITLGARSARTKKDEPGALPE